MEKENAVRRNRPSPDMLIMSPQQRLINMDRLARDVSINPKIPISKYWRAASEMVRLGNVYLSEKQYENSYLMFRKFQALFGVHIVHHPEYRNASDVDYRRLKEKLLCVKFQLQTLEKMLLNVYLKEQTTYLQRLHLREQIRMQPQAKGKPSQKGVDDRTSGINYNCSIALFNKSCIQQIFSNSQIIPKVDSNTTDCSSSRTLNEGVPHDEDREKPYDDQNIYVVRSEHEILPPLLQSSSSLSLHTKQEFATTTAPTKQLLIFPKTYTDTFLAVARENTEKNEETMAYVCGREMSKGIVHVSQVLIPKQTFKHGAIAKLKVDQVFRWIKEQKLEVCGWIRTQSARATYMNCLDVHEQYNLQRTNPSSVTVVCNVQKNETLVATLTDYGMNMVSSCQKRVFHRHNERRPLYTSASNYQIDETGFYPTEIVDFRKQREKKSEIKMDEIKQGRKDRKKVKICGSTCKCFTCPEVELY